MTLWKLGRSQLSSSFNDFRIIKSKKIKWTINVITPHFIGKFLRGSHYFYYIWLLEMFFSFGRGNDFFHLRR